MNPSSSSEDRLVSVVDSLIDGFQTLITRSREHRELEKALRRRLDFAADEYDKLLNTDGSVSEPSVGSSQVAKQIRDPLPELEDPVTLEVVQRAQSQIQRYKMAAQRTQPAVARCPVTHATLDPEDMEQDFTTPGRQGNLGCPFAKMAAAAHPHTPVSVEDPIAAEFHQDLASVRSPVTDQRPGQCPIRFLDQHSPEEVAQYFENHKHEIPRSHEICVRRYQGNETSARQLDAKYGNLVNMIQGLGVKHKAYLPDKDRIEEQEIAHSRTVETWAENVGSEPTPPGQDAELQDEEPRLSHFEKPLREVRVGESPSRPWGISIPPDKVPIPSALQSEVGAEHEKIKPFASSSKAQPAASPVDLDQPKTTAEPSIEKSKPQTQIIFNGPVFFGYSAEQVATLLQNTSLGNTKPDSA